MKRFIGILGGLIITLTVLTTFESKAQDNNIPHVQFKETKFNYGDIELNADGNHVFKFTNTGQAPLIINNVQSSCGCTVAKKPGKPIMPGESEVIKVRYNTNRAGAFRKTITVHSNADNARIILEIKGKVIPKPKEEMPLKPQGGFAPVAK